MAKKKQPTGENESLLERGQKQRAGRMLSEYIRSIGQEVSEVIDDDVPKGCTPGPPRLVSKAERLARWLWSRALPHTGDDGCMIPPDLDVVKIVLDRVEGKPGIQGQEDADRDKESVPDRISRMNADRVNNITAEVMRGE